VLHNGILFVCMYAMHVCIAIQALWGVSGLCRAFCLSPKTFVVDDRVFVLYSRTSLCVCISTKNFEKNLIELGMMQGD